MDGKYTAENYASVIEAELKKRLYKVSDGQDYIVKAMEYSLSNGGKRIRPTLVMEFCNLCGGNTDDALNFACAVEMIHTYSLIHDDLPCMDNDDFRRGKPSCHKAFGEEYALLAGDGLLTLAFETALRDDNDISASNKIKAVRILANLAGVNGMVGGQVLDLQAEKSTPDFNKIKTIDRLKTGALIKAAVLLGCYAANMVDEAKLAAAEEYAECVGLAFQIVDDILDITSDTQTLGKPVGSDIKNDKVTYVSLLGIEKSKEMVDMLTGKAITALEVFDSKKSEFLKNFAISLADRKK